MKRLNIDFRNTLFYYSEYYRRPDRSSNSDRRKDNVIFACCPISSGGSNPAHGYIVDGLLSDQAVGNTKGSYAPHQNQGCGHLVSKGPGLLLKIGLFGFGQYTEPR